MYFTDVVSNFTTFLRSSEAAVVETIAKNVIGQDNAAATAVADIEQGVAWVSHYIPTIINDARAALSLVQTLGVGTVPVVSEAVTALNIAISALTSFQAAQGAGESTLSSLVEGYTAVKAAQASVSTVKSAAVATKVVPAAKPKK